MNDQRQRAYLQAFTDELQRLIDSGEAPEMAERLAHAHAAHSLNAADAVRDAVSGAVQVAAEGGAQWQRARTQGRGGKASAAPAQQARAWVIEQWQTRKNEAQFRRANAPRGSVSAPSKSRFAEVMTAPGGPLEIQFPGQRFTAKTVAEVWLKAEK